MASESNVLHCGHELMIYGIKRKVLTTGPLSLSYHSSMDLLSLPFRMESIFMTIGILALV
jgi:hypothetical protein